MKVWMPVRAESRAIDLKKEYNKLLVREKKAEVYLDNESIPLEKKEKHVPAFLDILRQLNEILFTLGNCNVHYTDQEVINGFYFE